MPWEISLLHFLSWNFIWFLLKEPITVQNFRLSTAQMKFHQICTLIGYFCWGYIKFQLKKLWRSNVSRYQIVVQNLKRNIFFVSKMTIIWWIFIRALKCLKNLRYDWSLLSKVYNGWPEKVQESIFHDDEESCKMWKKKWLVIWKMTWGIWQIFIRTLENVKIGIFMGSFFPK